MATLVTILVVIVAAETIALVRVVSFQWQFEDYLVRDRFEHVKEFIRILDETLEPEQYASVLQTFIKEDRCGKRKTDKINAKVLKRRSKNSLETPKGTTKEINSRW